ncbi:MAG: hypothetical protein AB7E79_16585 [Rhodospirillaceae bacterium]
MKTYLLTRVPAHHELQRALAQLPKTLRTRLADVVAESLKIDLGAALANDDPDTLTAAQRRALAQIMQDRGAAFMISGATA